MNNINTLKFYAITVTITIIFLFIVSQLVIVDLDNKIKNLTIDNTILHTKIVDLRKTDKEKDEVINNLVKTLKECNIKKYNI